MKIWRWFTSIVIIAIVIALAWYWLGSDPGEITINLGRWEIQTTLIVAVVAILLAIIVISLVWRLVRWPFVSHHERKLRAGHKRLVTGMTLLAEGHFSAAERTLTKAAKYAPQKSIALLGASQAAAQRGEHEIAQGFLEHAAKETPLAARNELAKLLRHTGHADEAAALLAPFARNHKLPPAGWLEYIKASMDSGNAAEAYQALKPLRQTGALSQETQNDTEAGVLAAAIETSPDANTLKRIWAGARRKQRKRPEVVIAYAKRAAQFGQLLAAMGEVESALKRQWLPELVETWGALPGGDTETRLRRAESWLKRHPDDVTLLSTLGLLCVKSERWDKAREYLSKAVDLAPDADSWETLGKVYAEQGNTRLSQHCYHNALRLHRHRPALAWPDNANPGLGHQENGQNNEKGDNNVPYLPSKKDTDKAKQKGEAGHRAESLTDKPKEEDVPKPSYGTY